MKTAAETMLSINIWSELEETGIHFAFLLLPYLEAWRGRTVKAAEITRAAISHPSVVIYEDVASGSFTTALDHTKRLLALGVNTILLSGAFLEWSTLHEPINDELSAWEEYLHAHHVDVIGVHGYGPHGELFRLKCTKYFKDVTEWRPESLRSLMEFIVHHSTEGCLLTPVGGTAYFMLDPTLTDISEQVRTLAGVQTERFEQFVERYGEFVFPFRQILASPDIPVVPAGPMPTLLDLRQ